MRKLTMLLVLVVGVWGLSLGSAVAVVDLEVAAGAWHQSLNGNFSHQGDTLDVGKDLNFGAVTKPNLRARLDLPVVPGIYFMYTPMSFTATNSRSEAFNFANAAFVANQQFQSKLILDHYDVALFYGIAPLSLVTNGALNVDLGINVRVYELEASISQEITDVKKTVTATLPLPMAYLRLKIVPPFVDFLTLEAEGRGISYRGSFVYSTVGRLKIIPPVVPLLSVVLGYRYDDIKIDAKEIVAELDARGPFAELALEF